jgi:hypothetical protein
LVVRVVAEHHSCCVRARVARRVVHVRRQPVIGAGRTWTYLDATNESRRSS